eukprot:Gb_41152 [translate_table: standard]
MACSVSCKTNLLWLSLVLVLSSLSSAFSKNASLEDLGALLSFKDSLNYHSLHNWNSNLTFCKWTGVTCSPRRQRVIELNLTGMGLEGSLSPFLANLSFLRTLDLSNNTFHGSIPPQLGRLFRLRILWLEANQFHGPIPSTIGNCLNLERVGLFLNKFNGSIPANLGACRNLVEFSATENQLDGNIPPEIALIKDLQYLIIGGNNLTGRVPPFLGLNLSGLIILELSGNKLQGPIPSELGMLTQLTVLHIYDNQLAGQIPPSLSNCTALQQLYLNNNSLTGHIPQKLGKLTNLEELLLWGNQLSGTIPKSLANCSQLRVIEVSYNQLTGVVPLDLGRLPLLERLYLSFNYLISGSGFPILFTSLANCSNLQLINLENNLFSGVLPLSIGQLSPKFSIVSFAFNNLEGKIPQQIGNLTGLTLVDLISNHFNGSIPSDLKRLQMLERWYMDDNRLEVIPDEIGQLKAIGEFSVTRNRLSGRIPDTIGSLRQLRRLFLNENQLSGNIPSSIGQSWLLEVLDLSDNRLGGHIPPEVASLPNLQFYFNLSKNMLQGSLPPEIGKMTMVQAIDLSGNRFSGSIPVTIGSCIALQYLNLSGNALTGPVPAALDKLLSLSYIDLSSNNLSGSIPNSLEKLKMLQHLNFSFNNLTGEIPKAGAFINITAASDDALLIRRITIPIAAVSAVVLCSLLVAALLWSRRPKKQSAEDLSLGLGHPRISYEELRSATDGFGERNLLGIGTFGSVHKGILTDGTMVAVKVLNLQNEAAEKSFTTESLVLQFMSNGSLEKLLHPAGDGAGEDACVLSLNDRLKVAIDVAQGMSYLHHDSSVQVVHCDLKPSNVLLDEDMTAHVSDFGIAKITCADSMDSMTSTLALKGSIGYIAPEYGLGGKVSKKGYVYSYGILLLEMLTRKQPTDSMFVGGLNLQNWVKRAFPDRLVEVADNALLKDSSDDGTEEVVAYKCLEQSMGVGLVCTRESSEERPNMRDVVNMLESIRKTFVGSARPSI